MGTINEEAVHPHPPRARRRYEPADPAEANPAWPVRRDQVLAHLHQISGRPQVVFPADLQAIDPTVTVEEWSRVLELMAHVSPTDPSSALVHRIRTRPPRPRRPRALGVAPSDGDPEPPAPVAYALTGAGWARAAGIIPARDRHRATGAA